MRGFVSSLLFAVVVTACSDSSGPANNGGSNFTARINGQQWSSGPGGVSTNGVIYVLPGTYSITGAQVGGYVLSIALYNIGKTGSYPLGVGPQIAGGTMLVSGATGGWTTALTGAAGAIHITTLTATRIAGTFSASLTPTSGASSGVLSVSEGQFDLQVVANGTVGPLPENAGSRVFATLDGVDFNASAAAGNYSVSSGGILVVSGNNDTRLLNLSLTGITAPGEYQLGNNPSRVIGVSNATNTSTNSWSSAGAGGSGTVIVTTISNSRLIGTFSGTLGPAPGSQTVGTMTIVNGEFNIGRIGAQ